MFNAKNVWNNAQSFARQKARALFQALSLYRIENDFNVGNASA
tara:strand:- start:345 stop:473 length:129 start_codon:yes stop_codon:yes gene_type:complete